jgi:hypothetical protein
MIKKDWYEIGEARRKISARIAICDQRSRTCFLRDKPRLGKVYSDPPWEMF